MSQAKLARAMARAAADAGQTATHCGVTIAARLPTLAGAFLAPSAAGMAEWNRAYTEKVAATWEGAFAASAAWQAVWLRAAFAPPSPAGLANDIMGVIAKAAKPARLRARANARRLTRTKPG